MLIIIIAAFGLTFNSSIVSEDKKELQELQTTAEQAFKNQNFQEAKVAYQSILQKIAPPFSHGSGHRVDWMTYSDLITRLASTYINLGDFAMGETVLSSVLKHNPPIELLPKISTLLARCYCGQNGAGKAYLTLKNVANQKDQKQWSGPELSFYHAVIHLLNQHHETLILKAKRYFAAGFYKEAKETYEKVLHGIESGIYPDADFTPSLILKKIRFCLSESAFYLCSQELENDCDDANKCSSQLLTLFVEAEKERKEFERALDTFDAEKQKNELDEYNYALFERGLGFYHDDRIEKAKCYFETLLKNETPKLKPRLFATTHLARIYLRENKPLLAKNLLEKTHDKIIHSDPLKYEVAFLKGESSFLDEDYETAIAFFEKSLPNVTMQKKLIMPCLQKLALCHVKLGQDPLKATLEQKNHLEKASKILEKLLSHQSEESLFFDLAEVYFEQSKLGAKKAPEKIENLLAGSFDSFSLEGQIRALRLRAKTKSDYFGKMLFLDQATEERYNKTSTYPLVWFERGICNLHFGIYGEALVSFEKAFALLEKSDSRLLLSLVEDAKLKPLVLGISSDKQEVLYLKVLLLSKLFSSDIENVEASLNQLLTLYPDTSFALKAQFLVAETHYKNKNYAQALKCFYALAESDSSSLASSSLFWAGECAEKQGDLVQALQLRKSCYEKYPLAPHADVAFFKSYSFDDYLTGKKAAIDHLKKGILKDSSSPVMMISHFLLGMHEKSLKSVIEHYQKAITLFESGQIQEKQIGTYYFYYRAKLELAKLGVEDSFNLLTSVVKDFEEPIFHSNPFPSIHEEALFLLASSHINKNEKEKGELIFLNLLDKYRRSGIEEGHYLPFIWLELSLLAKSDREEQVMLDCLKFAEECGIECLNQDQKLSLWIAKSECLKNLNLLDACFTELCKVIEEDPSSSLSLKALYLRAEVYELQGKDKLARQELEALCKKGGTWGLHAEVKLKNRLGAPRGF